VPSRQCIYSEHNSSMNDCNRHCVNSLAVPECRNISDEARGAATMQLQPFSEISRNFQFPRPHFGANEICLVLQELISILRQALRPRYQHPSFKCAIHPSTLPGGVSQKCLHDNCGTAQPQKHTPCQSSPTHITSHPNHRPCHSS